MNILDTFKCKSCGHEKEEWRDNNLKAPILKCDECGSDMKKAFKNLNFSLKGQGWVSKGTGTASSPKHGKEVGIAIDHDKKREMKENGEI